MDFDAIVIGGSFAGLEAATYLARGLRSVCVIDSGKPRNRFAAHSHGYLSRDGDPPMAILEAARTQVTSYPTVTLRAGVASSATAVPGGFEVQTEDGMSSTARRLVLAFGVSDELPSIPGLAERWGSTVIHCPYCHGYEFAGQRLGVLYTGERSDHQARLIREWGPTTYFLDGHEISAGLAAELDSIGITIVREPVDAIVGDGPATSGVRIEDGSVIPIDALYIAVPTRLNSDLPQQLGCAVDDSPSGPIVRTDDMQATTVPGVFAAGDIVRGFHSVTLAAADGLTAGTALHRSLIFPD